jgi:hypothetical protein
MTAHNLLVMTLLLTYWMRGLVMVDSCFQVGDRVRVRASTFLQVGRRGTIVQAFIGEDSLYDVQFDDAARPYLLLGDQLERSGDAMPAGLRRHQTGATRTAWSL